MNAPGKSSLFGGLTPPRNALQQQRQDTFGGSSGNAGTTSPALRLGDYLRLQPYGRALLTPAAAAWIGSARMVILLMASLEGFVWGAVGFSLVPEATAWLAPLIGGFLFALMFSVIWILDASLIMSEKPRAQARPDARQGAKRGGMGPRLRWLLGLLVRIAIVAVSLYVTAPFIEKLIRADDIEAWHQAQVERYHDERERLLREQIEARTAQREADYRARIQDIEQQLRAVGEELEAERQRRDQLSADARPEIEVLVQDFAEARQRVGDELLGRAGRPQGYGPEARRWEARAQDLEEALAEQRRELAERLAPSEARIDELRQRRNALNDAMAAVRDEARAMRERIAEEVAAEQPPAEPPKLTFAAQSKALNALREDRAEQDVPHFETVEGFAQAALGVLFFALIALKLFEPAAVQAYYSETVQVQYRHYINGDLADIPGFGHPQDAKRRLSPAEFAQRWEQWERDPAAFVANHRVELEAQAHLARLNADHTHERELLSRRREGIDHQLALEHRQREAELKAREHELALRLKQMEARLGDETELQRERERLQLERERQNQALEQVKLERKHHGQQQAELRQRLEHHRAQLGQAREQQLSLVQTHADNQQAISATRQTLASLEAKIQAKQPLLEASRAELASLQQQRAATGSRGPFGPLAARARALRRSIRRLERALAPDQKTLDEQRGRLVVLEMEAEQLQQAIEDSRASVLELRRRCDDERAALDALLLMPASHQQASPPTTAVTST